MKFTTTLALAGVASAIVIPDASVFDDSRVSNILEDTADRLGAWWDSIARKIPDHDTLLYAAGDFVDTISEGIQKAAHSGKETLEHVLSDELDLFSVYDDDETDHPRHPRRPKHPPHHGSPNLTIYQLVQNSEHTKKFAKLVDDFSDVVKLLNSTDAGNFTLFVPTDKAFDKIPHHGDGDKEHKKPPKEVIEAVLKYHIATGLYPAGRILHTHTIPTAHKESWLADHAQRLRVRVGLGGVRLNFFSKVVAANIPAKNGVIHAVDNIIVPPPMVGRIISLFPQRFSTLLLAFEKTDFVSFIHNVPMSGSTVFAPSNDAFQRLGPRANAFLFNTPTGLKYLKAILKYHIVANSTLYSDAYYDDKGGKEEEDVGADGSQHYHLDLPTLLEEKSVAVDISRWGGWIRLKVNGYIPVAVQDVVARNGVIHVVPRVLIPPHKGGRTDEVIDGEIEVDELKERLSGYVEDEEQSGDQDIGEL